MDKNLNIENNNKYSIWTCEKCQNVNLISDFRCLKCNYFNYDAYSGKYQDSNNIDENKISSKKKTQKPIILKGDFIDYNFKEEYEFKRQEKHKFIKCWKCGRENIYYKVKCNYCRFPINDGKITKIEKTQLSQYDIIHNIPLKNYSNTNEAKNKKSKEQNEFRNIEIKYNKPIKENIIYKNLGNNWECKFCKKFNRETIKYCEFCYKNRL